MKKKFLIPAFLSIGLMSHFEIATSANLSIQFIFLIIILIIKKRISLKTSFLSVLAFIFTLLPLIIFNFKHNSILIKSLFNSLPKSTSIHQITQRYVERMFQNHLEIFKFNFLSAFNLSHIVWPLIVFILIFGTFLYLKNKRVKTYEKLFLIYIISSPITLFIIFMLYLWPVWQWWFLELMIFYIFAFAQVSNFLLKENKARSIMAILFFIFSFGFVKDTILFYKNDFSDFGGTAKIKGKIQAIDYIYNDAAGKNFNLLVFSPPVYTFPYDYLLWWHGQKKYGYILGNEKKKTFYLLIEPDPQKPWSYKGWLETVVKTGTIISTTELPSGFIIQKRTE